MTPERMRNEFSHPSELFHLLCYLLALKIAGGSVVSKLFPVVGKSAFASGKSCAVKNKNSKIANSWINGDSI